MKKIVLSIVAITLLLAGCREHDNIIQESNCEFTDFYYYQAAPVSLGGMSNNYIVLGVDSTYSDSQIQRFLSTVGYIDQNYTYRIRKSSQYKFKEIPLRLNASKTCRQIAYIIAELERNAMVTYVHYAMNTDNCSNYFGERMGNLCIKCYGNSFTVNVFNPNDLTDLNRIIAETRTELVRQDIYMPESFEVRATKFSNGDALKMANYFNETGLFRHTQPSTYKYPVE